MKHPPELPAQTALRGFGALTVFLAHANYASLFPSFPLLQTIYSPLLWQNEAVDLFFVLSGFILCYVYSGGNFLWRDYVVARFARIYPAYALSLVVLLGYVIYDHHRGYDVAKLTPALICSNIFLVQNWPFLPTFGSINFPSWSVSVEIFLYLILFPVLCFLDARARPWHKIGLILVPIVAELVVGCLTWGHDQKGFETDWVQLNPLRGVLCFTSGFFACSLGRRSGFVPILKPGVEQLCLVFIVACLLFRVPFDRKVAILFFPLLAYLSAQGNSWLSGVLAGRPLKWLGDVSYSIYLWHWPVLCAASRLGKVLVKVTGLQVLPHALLMIAYMFVTLGMVLGVSHWMHFHFERPIGKWLRGRFSSLWSR